MKRSRFTEEQIIGVQKEAEAGSKTAELARKPGTIVSANGTELTSNAVLEWCGKAKVEWHYTAPGKAHPERIRREFQRADARRTAQ